MALYTNPITADSKIGQDAQVNRVAIPPDNQEIQRRRDLVRTLFNDFWRASDDKPASFASFCEFDRGADHLDQAETYLNERLSACGEFWRLDAKTRAMLGLPLGAGQAVRCEKRLFHARQRADWQHLAECGELSCRRTERRFARFGLIRPRIGGSARRDGSDVSAANHPRRHAIRSTSGRRIEVEGGTGQPWV